MSELLTVHEVAQITRLHEMTIRRHIRGGRLSAVRVGRCLRVSQEAVATFMTPAAVKAEETCEEHYLTGDDPLFSIIGLGEGKHPDMSDDKYRYFDEVPG